MFNISNLLWDIVETLQQGFHHFLLLIIKIMSLISSMTFLALATT